MNLDKKSFVCRLIRYGTDLVDFTESIREIAAKGSNLDKLLMTTIHETEFPPNVVDYKGFQLSRQLFRFAITCKFINQLFTEQSKLRACLLEFKDNTMEDTNEYDTPIVAIVSFFTIFAFRFKSITDAEYKAYIHMLLTPLWVLLNAMKTIYDYHNKQPHYKGTKWEKIVYPSNDRDIMDCIDNSVYENYNQIVSKVFPQRGIPSKLPPINNNSYKQRIPISSNYQVSQSANPITSQHKIPAPQPTSDYGNPTHVKPPAERPPSVQNPRSDVSDSTLITKSPKSPRRAPRCYIREMLRLPREKLFRTYHRVVDIAKNKKKAYLVQHTPQWRKAVDEYKQTLRLVGNDNETPNCMPSTKKT